MWARVTYLYILWYVEYCTHLVINIWLDWGFLHILCVYRVGTWLIMFTMTRWRVRISAPPTILTCRTRPVLFLHWVARFPAKLKKKYFKNRQYNAVNEVICFINKCFCKCCLVQLIQTFSVRNTCSVFTSLKYFMHHTNYLQM